MADKTKTVVLSNTVRQAAAPSVFAGAHQDEKRALVRVKMRPGHKSTVIGGMRVKAEDVRDDGWIYLPLVFESTVPRIEAATEDDAALRERAQEMFDRALASYIHDNGGKKAEADTERGRLLREDLARRFPNSVEAQYHKLKGHSFTPFVECEVIETGIAPPETESERTMRMLLDRLGVTTTAAAGADSAKVAALEAENAELHARIARIESLIETATAPSEPSKGATKK